MKKLYLLPLAIGLGLATQSCGDFLDTKPAAIYSPDLVWGSASNVEAFIMGRYSTALGFYLLETWDVNYTTNMINCRSGAPGNALGQITADNFDAGLNSRFSYIRNCNMIIEECSNSEVLDPTEKVQYVALGKLLRAMCYYDFARKCGKFMWVDKVLDEDSDFDIPLTSGPVESYGYVLKDLREAIPDLPATSLAGAPNKNYALALLSEVCLTAAAYTNNSPQLQQNGVSLYQEAINAVDQISGYSLDPNFGDMFNQNGAYSSPEIMLAYYYDGDRTRFDGTLQINLIANVVNSDIEQTGSGPAWTVPDQFECWMEWAPSQNLVDDYLVVDEQDGLAKPWNETSQWLNNTKEVSEAEIFAIVDHKDEDQAYAGYILTNPDANISDLMFNNRDARFDASILHDGSEFYGQTLAMCSYGNMSRWARTPYAGNHCPLTNYATRKTIYTDISPRPFWDVYHAWHRVVMRYGHALLNKAEAQLQLGDVAGAVATFNQTRTIHGQLPASTASSLADAWTDYKRERHAELFWESDYYFSLLRWGMYGGEANYGNPSGSASIPELTEPAYFMEINQDRDACYVGIVQFNNNRRQFNQRSYLFPIYQGLINANPAITQADQNPGY